MSSHVLVIGLGEVGKPLMEVLGTTYSVKGKDLEPLNLENVDVLHICYPYQIDDFIGTTVDYIHKYNPSLTVVNSTVVPGTIRETSKQAQVPIAYSPVRGKHARMKEELLHYKKFVAGTDHLVAEKAKAHFEKARMNVQLMSSCETLELAKLLETTYFGVLIAWAQEMDRYCGEITADYEEVMQFMKEIDYLPPVVFQPGYIGGHCVIQNISLLKKIRSLPITEAILTSNELKAKEWKKLGKSLDEKLSPKPKS